MPLWGIPSLSPGQKGGPLRRPRSSIVQSGTQHRQGRISKAGNPVLRTLLVEAAHSLARFSTPALRIAPQGQSSPSGFHPQIGLWLCFEYEVGHCICVSLFTPQINEVCEVVHSPEPIRHSMLMCEDTCLTLDLKETG